MQLTVIENTATMSSREIADLVRSTHDSVLKTIRRLIEEGVVSGNETPYTHPQNRQTYYEFHLSFRDTMIVASGYSVEMRAKIIDRWQELESARAKPQAELSTLEILQIAMESEQGRLLAIEQRDEAIRTKKLIGERREATAMNTASQAVKKVNKLEIELDKSKEYATVKRMEMQYHGTKFSWRLLKSTATEMDTPAIDVFDANYGTVKAYHSSVWLEAYAISVE